MSSFFPLILLFYVSRVKSQDNARYTVYYQDSLCSNVLGVREFNPLYPDPISCIPDRPVGPYYWEKVFCDDRRTLVSHQIFDDENCTIFDSWTNESFLYPSCTQSGNNYIRTMCHLPSELEEEIERSNSTFAMFANHRYDNYCTLDDCTYAFWKTETCARMGLFDNSLSRIECTAAGMMKYQYDDCSGSPFWTHEYTYSDCWDFGSDGHELIKCPYEAPPVPECFPICQQGTCVFGDPDYCQCDSPDEWTGPACDTWACICDENGGYGCDGPGTCDCFEYYSGTQCEEYNDPGVSETLGDTITQGNVGGSSSGVIVGIVVGVVAMCCVFLVLVIIVLIVLRVIIIYSRRKNEGSRSFNDVKDTKMNDTNEVSKTSVSSDFPITHGATIDTPGTVVTPDTSRSDFPDGDKRQEPMNAKNVDISAPMDENPMSALSYKGVKEVQPLQNTFETPYSKTESAPEIPHDDKPPVFEAPIYVPDTESSYNYM